MNSKRRTYYKSFLGSINDQEPQAGTSNTNDPNLNVVRKLTFQTPQKQKNAQKNKKKTASNNNNQSRKKLKLSEPIVLSNEDKETTPVDNNIQQIHDLTNENNDLPQNDKFTKREEDSMVQKELEIFREIERLHEINEACDQIRQEHFNDCGDQYEMNIDEFNLGAPNFNYKKCNEKITDISLKEYPIDSIEIQVVNFTASENKDDLIRKQGQVLKNYTQDNICLQDKLENYAEKNDLSKSAMDLKCTEDFKEIFIDFHENGENKIEMISPEIDENNEDIKKIRKSFEKREDHIDDENKCVKFKDIVKSAKVSEENDIMKSLLILPESEKNDKDLIDNSVQISQQNNELDLNQQQSKNKCGDNNGDFSHDKNKTGRLKQIKFDEYVKNKRLRQQKRQKYVDFLSDNEDFVWSSTSWENSGSEISDSEDVRKKLKKTKQKKKLFISVTKSTDDGQKDKVSKPGCSASVVTEKKKRMNIRKETKRKRETGQEYINKKGKIVPGKDMKPNPCCPDKCTNKCYEISEERRNTLFSHFWSLENMRRKDWLISHSKKLTVKRPRSSDISNRTNTFNYFINEGEGQKQVCQQFLLCTLDIKQKTLYNTVSNAIHGSASADMRGKHVPSNRTSDLVLENLRKYIQELPALPSHYCRKNSKRTYLPQEFRNITNLYRIYKETQEKKGLQFVGEKVFQRVFKNEFNIGFHFPRKDKCLKCTQFTNDGNINEEEKQKHLKDKEETTERFKAHQEIHKKDDTILCATFDLQKVLNTPHGENMMLYYSRKLAVYNLTFYESCTKNGFCYTWSEIDGKRGANEVSSILQKYIVEVDQRGTIKHLLLYCDSCPGQNKNKTVLTCINETLKNCNNLFSIQINYLLPGHTYMPVDSVHSVIEKSLCGVIIWAPSQWSTVFALARKSPKPYEVEVLTYNDFNKWDTIADKYFKGNLVGKISKLRTVTFKKSSRNMAFVKFSMNPDAETEQIEITKEKVSVQLKPCYKGLLSVSKKKYMDLNKLCTNKVIPVVYHEEYKRLNYANNIQDCLIDTDIDDEENDEY